MEATLSLIEKSHIKSLSHNVWGLDISSVETQLSEIMNLPDVAFLELRIPNINTTIKGQRPAPSVQIVREYQLSYRMGEKNESLAIGTLIVAVTLENIYAAAKTVDQKTMTLQYFETLKEMGQGESTKYIFPMEFTSMIEKFVGGSKG